MSAAGVVNHRYEDHTPALPLSPYIYALGERLSEVCKRLYGVSQSYNHVVFSCVWTTQFINKQFPNNFWKLLSIHKSKHPSYKTSLDW